MDANAVATIVGAIIATGGVLFATLLGVFFANRNDTQRRHDENRQKWEEQKIMLREHVPHSHKETSGVLTYDGLIRWRGER